MKKQPLIDASMKGELIVILDQMDESEEAYAEELVRLRQSLERIRKEQFELNAAIERVQARSLKDILIARLNQISKQEAQEAITGSNQ